MRTTTLGSWLGENARASVADVLFHAASLTGTGKSSLLRYMSRQDIRATGRLFTSICTLIPLHDCRFESLWARHHLTSLSSLNYGRSLPRFRTSTLKCLSAVTMKTRVMYIERKEEGLSGPARIGRVTFSKPDKSIYYQGRRVETLSGRGYKANYFEYETGEHYWISGCKKKGGDRLYLGLIEIDPDAREEYWTNIRQMPEKKDQKIIRCTGKYGGKGK